MSVVVVVDGFPSRKREAMLTDPLTILSSIHLQRRYTTSRQRRLAASDGRVINLFETLRVVERVWGAPTPVSREALQAGAPDTVVGARLLMPWSTARHLVSAWFARRSRKTKR